MDDKRNRQGEAADKKRGAGREVETSMHGDTRRDLRVGGVNPGVDAAARTGERSRFRGGRRNAWRERGGSQRALVGAIPTLVQQWVARNEYGGLRFKGIHTSASGAR